VVSKKFFVAFAAVFRSFSHSPAGVASVKLHGKPGLYRIVQKDKNGPGGTTRYKWAPAKRKLVEQEQGA